MNIWIKRKLLILGLTISLGIGVTGCSDSPYKFPPIKFSDTILFSHIEPQYEVVLGLKTLYVLAGEYRGLAAGTCVTLTKEKYQFSIGALLDKNPGLKTPRALQAAKKQQIKFKELKSVLYDPELKL